MGDFAFKSLRNSGSEKERSNIWLRLHGEPSGSRVKPMTIRPARTHLHVPGAIKAKKAAAVAAG